MICHRRFFLSGLASLPLAPFAIGQIPAVAAKLITAARQQIGVTRGYDGA